MGLKYALLGNCRNNPLAQIQRQRPHPTLHSTNANKESDFDRIGNRLPIQAGRDLLDRLTNREPLCRNWCKFIGPLSANKLGEHADTRPKSKEIKMTSSNNIPGIIGIDVGRELAANLEFPEAPIALEDGSVLIVEIAGGRLTRISPSGAKHTVAKIPGGPNGAAIGPDGKCYVCNNGGYSWHRQDGRLSLTGRAKDYAGGRIEQVDIETGTVRTLYESCDGNRLRGPNDLVFDEAGGFWFTDLGQTYDRVMDLGTVYYARTDGSSIKEAIYPVMTPNGIGLSPDNRTLYVSETQTSRVWSFAITGEGQVEKMPWPSPHGGKLLSGLPGFQYFDSLAVEAGGNVCVATLGGGGISVFSPEGDLLEFHRASDVYCTNLCFGGTGMQTAFVTLSGTGRLISMEWPRPGQPLHFSKIARSK
jgi:gluconolactonase